MKIKETLNFIIKNNEKTYLTYIVGSVSVEESGDSSVIDRLRRWSDEVSNLTKRE